jgi:hypothetical protein
MVSLLFLLDFSKAFDKINHGRLLKKLRTFGLSDGAISWFVSYLHDPAQCVSVGGKCSGWLYVNSGVPQGPILGPFLFSLYNNDIGGNLKYFRHHFFDDDCQIYYSLHPDDIDAAVRTVNEDLMAIQRWALANGLSLNSSKTQVLLCGAPHKLIIAKRSLKERLFLNGAELTFSEVVKNLGVLFDESLSGKHQVNHVIRQVYLRLRQLYHFLRLLPSSIKIKLVKSLIFPSFDHADGVFCELSAGLESKLTKALITVFVLFALSIGISYF